MADLANLHPDASSRAEKFSLFSQNSISSNLRVKLLPEDFFIVQGRISENLTQFYREMCSVLSMTFLANFSELKGSTFSYKISGYRNISVSGAAATELSQHWEMLTKIYSWAYEGGNNSDKVGLLRNVISLHLDDGGRIRFDNALWNAIQSNYQIYLKDNIQSYLEVKNKLGEFVVESTSKTYAMADELVDAFKNNALILATFLLTVVVVNGLKDTGEATVFSNAYLAIVVVLTIVSGIWLIMTRVEVVKRFDNGASTIASVLKLNYQRVLLESEIDESINPVISLNRSYLVGQVKRYTGWWLGMLVAFVLVLVICNRIFAVQKQEVGKQSSVDVVQPEKVIQRIEKKNSAPEETAPQDPPKVVKENLEPRKVDAPNNKDGKSHIVSGKP